jgi:hypothetical protein
MELEELKQRWREEAVAETHVALDTDEVTMWIEARARDAHREVRRRLRQEAAVYIAMLVPLSLMALLNGVSGAHLALFSGLTVAVGAILATLSYWERRLAGLALDRSVREVLGDLVRCVRSAGRAYEIAYVGFIAAAMVSIGVVVWERTGSAVWLALTLLGGALAVVWARSSGRAYVNRMFGRHRAELADCLRELERP